MHDTDMYQRPVAAFLFAVTDPISSLGPDASYIVELITSTSSETRILIPLDARTAGYCNDIKKLHADLAGQA